MRFTDKPLAITDVETTGLDANIHEIVDIGLLVVNQKTLKVIDKYAVKIKPTNLKHAAKAALAVCGYNTGEWRNAVSLEVAMEIYSEKTKNCVFLAHNVFFDWSFITRAFQKTGIEDFTDYHRVDLFSVAWSRRNEFKFEKFNLAELCKQLGVKPEPKPHRASNGAMAALEVLRKL